MFYKQSYKYCPTCTKKLKTKVIDGRKRLFCLNCDFIFWANPKPVVSAILTVNNKILMLQRDKDPLKRYWVLPGGFIEYEETSQQAIKREVKEETGLDIDIKKIIGTYLINNDPRGNHIDIIYIVTTKDFSRIKINNENIQFKLFSYKNIPKLIAYKHREAIRDYLQSKGV